MKKTQDTRIRVTKALLKRLRRVKQYYGFSSYERLLDVMLRRSEE